MLLRLHHAARIAGRRIPHASCTRTRTRGYSDSADDSIKRLQNAFQTPGSPFYLAPGERGPSEPHNWPEHDTASAFVGDRTESHVRTGSASGADKKGPGGGAKPESQHRSNPAEPSTEQRASRTTDSPSSTPGPGWPHNLPQYTNSRSQGISYAKKHGFDLESMVEWPVAWGEQDQFRHVNNVAFARYFETARVRVMQGFESFLSPQTFREFISGTGMGLVVKSILVEYKRPVTFPDSLIIMSRPTNIDPARSSFGLRQAAWSLEQGKVVAECTSVQVMYDFKGLKKGVMTDEVKHALDAIATRCSESADT